MKLLTFAAACAAAATLSAAPAFAGESVVAKLAAPVAQPTKFIAGEAVFNCEGDTCVAASPQSLTFSASACKTVAAKVTASSIGPVILINRATLKRPSGPVKVARSTTAKPAGRD